MARAERASRAVVLSAVFAAAAPGCGALGGGTGGAENLPNRGVVPYRASVDAPRFVVAPSREGAAFSDPSAEVEGDRLSLFFTEGTEEGARILRAESEDGERFGEAAIFVEPAVAPAWVEGRALAPGTATRDGVLHVVFEAGEERAIGHAIVADDEVFIDPDPLLERVEVFELGGVGSPSLLFEEDEAWLYYTARDSRGVARLARARFGPDLELIERRIVLSPGEGCAGAETEPTPCWDGDGVSDPEARRSETAAGRVIYRLFYTGSWGEETGLVLVNDEGRASERF